mgnify:FL=1
MTDLMKKIAPMKLHKVVGIAINKEENIVHVDEGRLYAARDEEDALEQAQIFWAEHKFEIFNGHARCVERVGDYKIVLVHDDEVGEATS